MLPSEVLIRNLAPGRRCCVRGKADITERDSQRYPMELLPLFLHRNCRTPGYAIMCHCAEVFVCFKLPHRFAAKEGFSVSEQQSYLIAGNHEGGFHKR